MHSPSCASVSPADAHRAARWRDAIAAALLLVALCCGREAAAAPAPQTDPELKGVVSEAIRSAECFPDKYDSAVWYTMMEPKLRRIVKDRAERLQILKSAYCEAHRADEQRLPPGLVMAVIEIESRFDRWAVSSAGAVGLMQVMPFWPEQLGMQRYLLTHVEPNMRMGCAILRHYLKVERNDVRKALARYNGSIGKRDYPDKIIGRWTRHWGGADDLGRTPAAP